MTTQTVGPYQLQRRLGSGGMAEVWEGWDERLQRQVAVKLVDRTSARSATEARRRLLREARAVAALDHPAVVRIHDVLEGEERDAIVMELVQGETLRQRIDRHGVLDERDSLVLALQVAEALAAAHKRGVVHRDLKTENVMVDDEGRVKILDFGLAKRLHAGDSGSFTYSGRILGTVRTMSPEQVTGEPVDERTDIYSLGVLLYESLTGISPFVGNDLMDTIQRITEHHQPPVRTINHDVTHDTTALVEHLLQKEREARPQTIEEVIEVLHDLVGTVELPSREVSNASGEVQMEVPRETSRIFFIAAVAMILIVVVMALAFWLLR